MNVPVEAVVDPRFRGSGLAYGEDPYWRDMAPNESGYLRESPFRDADLVDSRRTAGVTRMVHGEEPAALNPPIPPNVTVLGSARPFDERGLAVMLSRFSEERRYRWVVRELMPRLLREVPSARLAIFGGAVTRTQLGYANRLTWPGGAGLGVRVVEGSALGELDSGHQVLGSMPRGPRSTMDRARVFCMLRLKHWGCCCRGLARCYRSGARSDLAVARSGLGMKRLMRPLMPWPSSQRAPGPRRKARKGGREPLKVSWCL